MKKLFLITGLMFAFVGLAEAQLVSPTLLTPKDAANLPLKKAAKFTWQKVTGASKYRLIFSNDKSFANYDANKFKCLNTKTCFLYTVASPSYNVAASHAMLKTNSNYFWQVQTVGKTIADNSKTGEIRTFSVSASVITKTTGYSKIANNGSVLSDDAKLGSNSTDWACTKDNKTGLIWEVKTDDGGLHDKDWYYSWYKPEGDNGGNAGYTDRDSAYGAPNCSTKDNCNTYAFTNAVNTQGLCGANDWRMPTNEELRGLVFCSDGKTKTLGKEEGYICTGSPTAPTINTTYFPNTQSEWFWSSSPDADESGNAWGVGFGNSYSGSDGKRSNSNVRLVR